MQTASKKSILRKGFKKVARFYRTTKIVRILVAVATIYILFIDSNSLIVRFFNYREINRLKSEISYYKKDIDISKERVKELTSNKENLEKFAREQFFMKKKNEDIFIIDQE